MKHLLPVFTALTLSGCCSAFLCGDNLSCTTRQFGYRCCMVCVEWPGATPCVVAGKFHGGTTATTGGKAVVGKHHPEKCRCAKFCTCWRGVFLGVNDPSYRVWTEDEMIEFMIDISRP